MISVAPMIGWTDKNYRFLIRQLTKQTTLYTEMVMDNALLHNPTKLDDFIDFDPFVEPPLVLQLGGNDPEKLAQAVEICENYSPSGAVGTITREGGTTGNFSEINLNCGCPSNKAKKAGFGAELMLEPNLVRQIVTQMIRRSSNTEITVKCRIGTNKRNSWEELVEFVEACHQGGVKKIVVHSRICVLCGLSPAQNRSIPPLRYDVTHGLVKRFPEMKFVLNGGLRSYGEIDRHLGVEMRGGEGGESWVDEEGGGGGGGEQEGMTQPHCQCDQYDSTTSAPPLPFSTSSPLFDLENYPPLSPFSNPLPPPSPCLLWSASATASASTSVNASTSASATSMSSFPVHGVMIGREAYHNPWLLADMDRRYYQTPNPSLSRREVLEEYLKYCDRAQERGEFKALTPLLCRPLHNYFHGHSKNSLYKRHFDELIKEYTSTRSQCRDVAVGEIVWRAIEGVIDEDYLEERMMSDGVMRRRERER
jgi:tRNA dihydrouridine synthase A